MRIRTIFIVGVALSLLLAMLGFYLGQRPTDKPVPATEDGYLSAIAPPATLDLSSATAQPASPAVQVGEHLPSAESTPAATSPPKTDRWVPERIRTARGDADADADADDAAPAPDLEPEQRDADGGAAASAASTAAVETTPTAVTADNSAEQASAKEGTARNEAKAKHYRIRAGDTLASIAVMHYGDASKWRLIARVNPAINPKQLQIGQTVILPPGGTGAEGEPQTREGQVLATHTVHHGDSLYSLAKRYYGDGKRWPAIREANPGLRGASLFQLKLGSKLIIPVVETKQASQ